MLIKFTEEKEIELKELLDLYNDANWTAYTSDPKVLENAIKNSFYVLTARHENKLVGLLRIVGDGSTIAYIQDILVLKGFKRNKIGTQLIKSALEKFQTIRQKVLLTEDNTEQRSFYESLGFESCDKGQLVSFVKLENK